MTEAANGITIRRTFFGPNGLRAGWRLLIFLVVAIIVIAVLGVLLNRVQSHLPHGMNPVSMLVQEAMAFGGILLITFIMSLIERRPLGTYGLPLRSDVPRKFWIGGLWGFVHLSAIMLLLAAFGVYRFGGIALGAAQIVKFGLLWAAVFLFVGLFEEYLFRGYLLYTITSGIGFWPAAAILSVLFAAAHHGNSGESMAGLVSIVFIAVLLCLFVRRTGNLWFAVGWHMTFDWGESFFYSVGNSGMQAQGHLFNSSMQGNVWLTGGTVGPEASVVMIVSSFFAIALFAWLYPEVKYPAPPAREPEAGLAPAPASDSAPV